MPRHTTETFIKRIEEKYNNEFKVLTEYKGFDTPVRILHKPCGTEFESKAGVLISTRGRRCPNCRGRRNKSPEVFRKEFSALTEGTYELLTEYKLSSKKVRVLHNICGHVYEVTPNGFLRGNRCPICHGNRATKKTTAQFKEEVYDLVQDEYTVLGEYINRSKNIKMRHKECGREYFVQPGNFLCGSRCIACHHEGTRLTPAQVEDYVLEHLGEGYQVTSDYINMQSPITIRHDDCGKESTTRLTDIVYKGIGCKTCRQSRGERFICTYLESKGLEFTPQKRFSDLKDISYLFYDFFLPKYNVLIEYQGSQHFSPKTFGGITKEQAKKNFEGQVRRDGLKREYAQGKGYTLWEPTYILDSYSKIEDYLDKKFNSLEVKQGVS